LEKCPLCGSLGRRTEFGYPDGEDWGKEAAIPNIHLEVLLDNLRSIYNVGSIFRTSDGAGIRRLYLGGYTPTPEHPKLRKTGLGSEWSVPWDHVRNGSDLVLSKISEGYHIYVLERTSLAISIFESLTATPVKPILLVLGNEKVGVDPEIINISHQVVYIPMAGRKHSLNVATAYGIAAYAFAMKQTSL
jgi:tRNA G18 (ribose-2'-O)-methylase SpoU